MVLSFPHEGKLINQIESDPIEKVRLVKEAQSMVKITIDYAKENISLC